MAAATATWYIVSAVASLSSPSPSIRVSSRGGSPARRATASAAIGSGGATAAPSASATAIGTTGTTASSTPPTANAVASTSPTDSEAIGRRLALMSMRLASMAAA